MTKIAQTNSKNEKHSTQKARQFSLRSTSTTTDSQSDIWPLDKNQYKSASKTFPLSWSFYPVNGLFFS